jgi:hypothetical protein
VLATSRRLPKDLSPEKSARKGSIRKTTPEAATSVPSAARAESFSSPMRTPTTSAKTGMAVLRSVALTTVESSSPLTKRNWLRTTPRKA